VREPKGGQSRKIVAVASNQSIERRRANLARKLKGADKDAADQDRLLALAQAALNEGKPARTFGLSDDDKLLIKPLCLLTIKPAMYVGNVLEDGFENNPHLDRLREHAAKEGAPVVALCAKIEQELADLDDADKQEFLTDLGLDEPGLNRLIRTGYELLGLQTYFTAGVKEVRAWTIHKGDTAPQAAGVIHTDFEKGFIRAQTISYADFIACGGEAGAKEKGKMRVEGKEYVVQDGDVMNFLFNV